MSIIINPIITNHNFFQSTKHRFNNLTRPIQTTKKKPSDFLAYVATPFIDGFILDTVFAIDASIHLLNALASLCKAAYFWTMNQQKTTAIVDYLCETELNEAGKHTLGMVSAITAQILNTLLSVLALVTRPIASLVHAMSDDSNQNQFAPVHR